MHHTNIENEIITSAVPYELNRIAHLHLKQIHIDNTTFLSVCLWQHMPLILRNKSIPILCLLKWQCLLEHQTGLHSQNAAAPDSGLLVCFCDDVAGFSALQWTACFH